MKHKLLLFAAAFLLAGVSQLRAQFTERDTIDVLHYDIDLTMDPYGYYPIDGTCAVTMRLLQPTANVSLGLMSAAILSVQVGDSLLPGGAYGYNSEELHIPTLGAQPGDTLRITIGYGSGGWRGSDGGFFCHYDIFYNLGQDRQVRPFSMGRSWFPCSDSVYDKATYAFRLTVPPTWVATCSGILDSTIAHPDSTHTFCYTLAHPTSTYQIGVAASDYSLFHRQVQGLYGTYPVRFANLSWSTPAESVIDLLTDHFEEVLQLYERMFGPYRWGSVGFSTTSTSYEGMEHVNNIAISPLSSSSSSIYVMDHEFAHQWFGNLITCASIDDLWINEGGATFADQEAAPFSDGALLSRGFYRRMTLCYPQANEGFHALHSMPHDLSFQSLNYYKGAIVFHELRHLLGDSLFFGSIQTLFERNAFTAMDSYQFRDSLSLYSGVDLTDFFDFHVFGPGFRSYSVDTLVTEGGVTTLSIRQHLYRANDYCRQALLPVTFFSYAGDSLTLDIRCDGPTARQQFSLPFVPDFAIIDYYNLLAEANSTEANDVWTRGTWAFFDAGVIASVSAVTDTVPLIASVIFSDGDKEPAMPGIVRWDNKSWQICNLAPSELRGSLTFLYKSYFTYFPGFCDNEDAKDSLRLFYRPDAVQPWQMLKATTIIDNTTGSREEAMRINNHIHTGEYRLAIVDTATLAIPEVTSATEMPQPSILLSPNPASENVAITVDQPDTKGIVILRDATGIEQLRGRLDAQGHGQLDLRSLPQGIYFVTYVGNHASATAKLIVRR